MQEENIAIRLKFLIQELGINNSVFAENCGISRATLSQMLTGRNKKISDIIIGQIHKAYPTLSIMWLLFNEGDMWIGDASSINNDHPTASRQYSDNMHREEECELINAYENPEFTADDKGFEGNAREIGLNQRENIAQNIDLDFINNNNKTHVPFNKIENIRPKSRKVVQITIYYDDSTFESFFPKDK